MNNLINKSAKTVLLTTLLSSATMTAADDTEIIDINKPKKSNVLLVVDMSGSMSQRAADNNPPAAGEQSRKDDVIDALNSVLSDPKLKDLELNVGLMSFSGDTRAPGVNTAAKAKHQTAHGIAFPVKPLYDSSHSLNKALPILESNTVWSHAVAGTYPKSIKNYRHGVPLGVNPGTAFPGPVPSYLNTPSSAMSIIDYLSTKSLSGNETIPDKWTPFGATPIVDALYEAARYFRGNDPKYGEKDPGSIVAAHPSTYDDTKLLYTQKEPASYIQIRDCNDSSLTNPPHVTGLADCLLSGNINHKDITSPLYGNKSLIYDKTFHDSCAKFDSSSTTTPKATTACFDAQSTKLSATPLSILPIENYRCDASLHKSFSSRSCDSAECSTVNSDGNLDTSCTAGLATKNVRNITRYNHVPTATERDDAKTAYQGTLTSPTNCYTQPPQKVCKTYIGTATDRVCTAYEYKLGAVCSIPKIPTNECREVVNVQRNCHYEKKRRRESLLRWTTKETMMKYESPSNINAVPNPGSGVNGVHYISPITEECPNNSIVLLSDGAATTNSSANEVQSYINNANGVGPTSPLFTHCSHDALSNGDPDPERCGPELARLLGNTDNDTSGSLTGDQVITLHTIAFAISASTPSGGNAKTYLSELSAEGNHGTAASATSLVSLKAALFNAITSNASSHSFSSPTNISSLTTLSSGSDVYVPVFDKGSGTAWSGNLKKYKRKYGQLFDKNNLRASNIYGALNPSRQDFWAASVSIDAVKDGGVASKLPAPGSRNIYTDIGLISGNNLSVSKLENSNTLITKNLLDDINPSTITPAYRTKLIKFIRGEKADGTARNHIGDIMHSKPVVVNYGTSDKRLFVGTNEGYLHSFDEHSGVEKFAFMPSLLLKNIKPQFENTATTHHIYGVDGQITLRHDDDNHNGIVDSGEKAILYFGLRRGGKAYYAIDVSTKDNPKFLWKIDTSKSGFSDLGFTWSKPVVMSMLDSTDARKPVIVFGGGYVDDESISPEADDSGTGANVYLVNANTGVRIWDLTTDTHDIDSDDVDYAVPANIRAMDVSGDGNLDRLYFADTGGNVWRVDFEGGKFPTSSKKAQLKHFADLGGSAPVRKFFTEPDVAIFKTGGKFVISVAIGSGQRPKPLDDTIDDRFFVMFDTDVRNIPAASTAIGMTNLADAKTGPVSDALSSGHKGWQMEFDILRGEKVLSRATTYNNKIIFNTFGSLYSSGGAINCGAANANKTRLYIVDLMTAKSVVDLNGGGLDTTGVADRSKQVGQGDIPDAPQVVFDESSTCASGNCSLRASVNVGKSKNIDLNDTDALRKMYWIDK